VSSSDVGMDDGVAAATASMPTSPRPLGMSSGGSGVSSTVPGDTVCGTCVVCQEDVLTSSVRTWLPCGHVFHASCLNSYVATLPVLAPTRCPTCSYACPELDAQRSTVGCLVHTPRALVLTPRFSK
jgi:hypothetical protein